MLSLQLNLTDGKSGFVEVEGGGFRVHVRKHWPCKQIAARGCLLVEWNDDVWTNKAADR